MAAGNLSVLLRLMYLCLTLPLSHFARLNKKKMADLKVYHLFVTAPL